ncbi:MAG: terminase small subunit [Acidaminococcaceae bacterium]
MVGLTKKQKLFVKEYLKDLNATQAYKRARYAVKSEAAAAVEGHKLLRNPKIEKAISEAMAEREKRTEITADRVLEELAKVAFVNIKEFYDKETGSIKNVHEVLF